MKNIYFYEKLCLVLYVLRAPARLSVSAGLVCDPTLTAQIYKETGRGLRTARWPQLFQNN